MVNKRVVELRKKLGLNQTDFAERIGFTRSFIALVETERNPLTEANIKLICHVFNVNEEWLRNGIGEMFQGNKSHLEDEVLEMFRGLSEKAQLMIRDYIRMVLEQQQVLLQPERGCAATTSVKNPDVAIKMRASGAESGGSGAAG
ncbi:MAG: helix-turn-helix domain-containing protein [Treponema sp.]|jgi:transcriptional regulator with XRE-family HTH domain|nr:helix-turn-helix domain-containing protein [Treponema sp.]